jgi:hypothetical protein
VILITLILSVLYRLVILITLILSVLYRLVILITLILSSFIGSNNIRVIRITSL